MKITAAKNLWVVDLISMARNFIKGLLYYSIVIFYPKNHKAVFAAVFDPTVNELYTVNKGNGAFLNGKRIQVNQNSLKKIILRVSYSWNRPDIEERVNQLLFGYEIENNHDSTAVNYCRVSRGSFSGIVSLTKDSFSEFVGGFIIKEAGGKFANLKEESEISAEDRIFVVGNKNSYDHLLFVIRKSI